MKKIILHISEVDVQPTTGMGRVEYNWKESFIRKGFEFIHIGPSEIGKIPHKALFSFYAWRYYKKLKITPFAIIAHEPSAQFFINSKIPVFIESHGIERKIWDNSLLNLKENLSLKTRILFPLWRIMPCDFALKRAQKLLLLNSDDAKYAVKKYHRKTDDTFVYRNGVAQPNTNLSLLPVNNEFTVLFNGSWIERKGIKTIVGAAVLLKDKKINVKYLLIGTGKSEAEVLADWTMELRNNVVVVPKFAANEENNFLKKASVFILPSLAEGQPLSLLQAMANGICCITTNLDGQKDFVKNDYNGFFIEPNNASQLAQAIEKCYTDTNITSFIGNNAFNDMIDRSWNNVADEVTDFVINTK